MENSLTEKTTNGVIWNLIDKFASYGIGFLVGIVLARLLSPEEYGLIGIIGIFTAVFNIILDGGFSMALIRKDKVSNEDYCTVFYTNLVVSCILTAVLFFGAPIISNFFNRPELTPYTRAMSFVLVLNALSITQQVQLTKRIDFKTQTRVSIIANLISGVIGIVMALMKFGVWALVCQQLSSRLFTTILLWVCNKWVPILQFSWKSFNSLFSYSWKLLLAQVIGSLWDQLYQAVIGKIYTPNTLGQYTRAHQYVGLSSSTIGSVVLKVSLPVMSEIQNDDARLLKAFRAIIKTTTLVSAILMIGMAACAESLIYVLIGEQWMSCVPMMQILCFSFCIYPLQQVNINMLIVYGRSDIQLLLIIIKCILAIGPIALGIFCGIYWMLLGSVVLTWIVHVLNSYYSGKKFNYTWWMQIKDIAPSLVISLLMSIPVYAISYLSISHFIKLPLQIAVGALVTIALCEIMKADEYLRLKSTVISYVSKIKGR